MGNFIFTHYLCILKVLKEIPQQTRNNLDRDVGLVHVHNIIHLMPSNRERNGIAASIDCTVAHERDPLEKLNIGTLFIFLSVASQSKDKQELNNQL